MLCLVLPFTKDNIIYSILIAKKLIINTIKLYLFIILVKFYINIVINF